MSASVEFGKASSQFTRQQGFKVVQGRFCGSTFSACQPAEF